MKKIILFLMTVFFMIGTSSVALATTISETVITGPASTENLWAYSYEANTSYIASASDYVQSGDSYLTNAEFQGYVTGEYGPWSYTNDTIPLRNTDSWGIRDGVSDPRSVHVFDTYITSTIAQQVTFTSSGDDGNSIFIDDIFKVGHGFYPASNVVTATLDMEADTQYKLTFIGSNYGGGFGWWFRMTGDNWTGAVSSASNITMNATAEQSPVPEPTTMLLFGIGLLGLVGVNRKRN